MKMKDLKMYVSPETEILDMEIEEPLLEASTEDPNWRRAAGIDDYDD